MTKFSKYIGLDVHKETIAVAVADGAGGEPRYWGEIKNRPEAVRRLLARLGGPDERLRFFYEAGPCGYGLYRQLVKAGLNLARLDRAGELTPVWVPDAAQEALRELSRAREDMKIHDKQLRQRLSGFLLRHGRIYEGKQRWTQAFWRWLELERFDSPYQQIVMEEYAAAVRAAQARTATLEQQLYEAAEHWSLGEAARALTALRGIRRTAAITLLAELDDISRFDNPSELMGYVGLVPSEYSSGPRRRQGGLTKAGNAHVRWMLVECAWAYRFPARRTPVIQRRAERASPAVQAIAWKAQKRLCGRFRRLSGRGVIVQKTVTAIARELCGFIWAVVCEVQQPGKLPASA